MPDRQTPNPTADEELLLDRWLDALNEPGRSAPPEPPAAISELATIARRYHDALGMRTTTPAGRAVTERNGAMHHPLPLTTPLATPTPERPTRRPGWLAHGLAGAAMLGLVLLLAGGALVRQYGLPGGAGGPTQAPGIVASPETALEDVLDCSAPGYRAVVEGEVNGETLASIGERAAPIQVDGVHINVPTANGEVVQLADTWAPLGGPFWASRVSPASAGEATIRNVETGQEWTYPDPGVLAGPAYGPPYLLMPARSDGTDWRIVNIETGEERLVSDIRGEPFPARVRVDRIAVDRWQREPASGTSVWLFNVATPEPGPLVNREGIGRNGLILPEDLRDARFIEEPLDAEYTHATAYSSSTNQLAFATFIGPDRAIVVLNPETGQKRFIRDERFSDEALPLMLSDDGSSLIVDQPDALFSVNLQYNEPWVSQAYDPGIPFVPIGHNEASGNVLITFEDRHLALVNAHTGEVTDWPELTLPQSNFIFSADPMARVTFETPVYELYDESTSTVRFIYLATGTVSPAMRVLDPARDSFAAPIGSEQSYYVQYPSTGWPGAHAFLDANGTLQVRSTADGDEMWSIPAPEDFTVDDDHVADLLVSPNRECLVMNLIRAWDAPTPAGGMRSGRVTTWIAPLASGAEWRKLDIAVTGWFERYDDSGAEMLPAPDAATPVATPSAGHRDEDV